MSARILPGWLTTAFVVASLPALGQEEPDSSSPSTDRRAVTFLIGGTVGGATTDLKAEMRRTGWADRSPRTCFLACVGPEEHPRSSAGGANILLGVRRALGKRLSIEGLAGQTPTGETDGYRASLGESVTVGHGVRWTGAVASVHAGRFRLGGGPALYWTRVENGNWHHPKDAEHGLKAGLLLDGGVATSLGSRLFLHLRAQYRVIGSQSVGPYPSSFQGAEFGAESVRFDHIFLGAGLGARF